MRKVFGLLAVFVVVLVARSLSWAETVDVSLTEADSKNFRLSARFLVRASSGTVWAVLTDYDHIGRFVPSIQFSRVKERFPDHLLLEQEGREGFLFFKTDFYVLLKVREIPFERIEFEDTAHRDFESYRGSWGLQKEADGIRISYVLETKVKFRFPQFIVGKFLKRDMKKMLGEVSAEIDRRSEK
jgi:ribosome-associated toxin RatA of RatAB toxin-antitoxin module